MTQSSAPPSIPPSDPSRSRAAVLSFLVLMSASIGALAYLLSDFVTDTIVGLMLAALSRPLYQRLVQRGHAEWASAALVTAVVGVVITVPTLLLLSNLASQAARAYNTTSQSFSTAAVNDALFGGGFWAQRLRLAFEGLGMEYSAKALGAWVGDVSGTVAGVLSRQVNALVSNALSAVYHFVLTMVIVYYGMLDGPLLKQRIFELSPLPDNEEQLIVDKFLDVGKAILFGNGIGSAAQGFLGGLSMWIFGMSSPAFWGVVMTLFAFLPLAGISIVIIPATIYLAITGHWGVALAFGTFNFVQAMLIENVLKTKLIGGRMRMHNALIFFSLLGGLSTFGVLGILYGPLVLALFTTVHDLYQRVYKERLLST